MGRLRMDELAILRMLTNKVRLDPIEAAHELDGMTAADWDDWFEAALKERLEGRVEGGYGDDAMHPTAKMFAFGIASIRAGRPSESFLTLLEAIADSAEERDVMSLVFSGVAAIKATTVGAARRETQIVEAFREHLRVTAGRHVFKASRRLGVDAMPSRRRLGYRDAISTFKAQSNYSPKEIDRALARRWPELGEWIATLKSERREDKISGDVVPVKSKGVPDC
jgi:hypothetical protein